MIIYQWNKTQHVVGVPGKDLTQEMFDKLMKDLGLSKTKLHKLLTNNGEFTKVKPVEQEVVEQEVTE